jgi:hypothetical protein
MHAQPSVHSCRRLARGITLFVQAVPTLCSACAPILLPAAPPIRCKTSPRTRCDVGVAACHTLLHLHYGLFLGCCSPSDKHLPVALAGPWPPVAQLTPHVGPGRQRPRPSTCSQPTGKQGRRALTGLVRPVCTPAHAHGHTRVLPLPLPLLSAHKQSEGVDCAVAACLSLCRPLRTCGAWTHAACSQDPTVHARTGTRA